MHSGQKQHTRKKKIGTKKRQTGKKNMGTKTKMKTRDEQKGFLLCVCFWPREEIEDSERWCSRGGTQGWARTVRPRRVGAPNPEKWAPRREGGGPEGWEGGREAKGWGPKFSAFFHLRPHFFFLSSSVHVWSFGLSCEAPQPESPNVHI